MFSTTLRYWIILLMKDWRLQTTGLMLVEICSEVVIIITMVRAGTRWQQQVWSLVLECANWNLTVVLSPTGNTCFEKIFTDINFKVILSRSSTTVSCLSCLRQTWMLSMMLRRTTFGMFTYWGRTVNLMKIRMKHKCYYSFLQVRLRSFLILMSFDSLLRLSL